MCAVLSSWYACSLNAVFFSTQAESEPKLTETEKKKLSLQETRRSLPIFPFRDDLMQAITDHQVSHCDVPAFPVSVLINALVATLQNKYHPNWEIISLLV